MKEWSFRLGYLTIIVINLMTVDTSLRPLPYAIIAAAWSAILGLHIGLQIGRADRG